jgi:hypothetical protein
MPKLPQEVINSVFYLYPTRQAAEEGKAFGGCGFFVGVPSGLPNYAYAYAVTNWHVAIQGGASVIRVNKRGGGVDIFEFDPSEWTFKPGGSDVAVIGVPLQFPKHEVNMLDIALLLTPDVIPRIQIGPGEDTFMIGRFVDHDGGGTNVPAARFGNISVMPQPIKQPTGSLEPSYILDMHSRTGYSGSPVFVYRTAVSDPFSSGITVSPDSQFTYLLGIHWGQFPELWEIGKVAKTPEALSITDDAKHVKGLSGMTMAVPAQAIRELIDMPHLKASRDAGTARERAARDASPSPVQEVIVSSAPASEGA